MNRIRILGLASAIPMLVAGGVTAQRPTFDSLQDRFDRNGDGVVSREEFEGPADRFERMDRNRDGRVTREEFAGAGPNRARPESPPRAPEGRGSDSAPSLDDPGGPVNPKRADVIDAMQARVEASGVQVGERMPDLVLQSLDGAAVRVSDLWKDQPLVLVTASITCPVAVRTCPTLDRIRTAHPDSARIAIVYVSEAHASPSGRAAADVQDMTAIPTGHGAYAAPASLDERLSLARLFRRQQTPEIELLVAGMDDAFPRSAGIGPNSGLLVDTNGVLRLKQGWYSPAAMQEAIRNLEGAGSARGETARAVAAASAGPPHLTFGLIADIQYADKPDGGRGGVRRFRSSRIRMERCVADMNARGVAFVVQLGDLVDSDRNYPGPQRPDLELAMRRDLETILGTAAALSMPFIHVIGNHDIDVGKEELIRRMSLKRTNYSFTHALAKGWRFIVTDGTDSRRTIGGTQAAWLRDALVEAARNDERVICFNHYTLLQEAAPNHDRLRNDVEILGIVENAANVATWFSGHDHGGGYAFRNGTHFVTLQAMVDAGDDNAYAVVRLFPDRIEVEGVGTVPDRTLRLDTARVAAAPNASR